MLMKIIARERCSSTISKIIQSKMDEGMVLRNILVDFEEFLGCFGTCEAKLSVHAR